jgi:hypothetical protein
MKGAIRAIESRDMNRISRASKKAEWPYSKPPPDIHIPKFSDITCMELRKEMLQHNVKFVNKYLSKVAIAERRKQSKGGLNRRNEWFDDPSGKGKGKFLKSVFKTARQNHALAWVRRPDGTLAMTSKEVGDCVKKKYESWFATVIPVEDRWGSWEKMMNFDTSEMKSERRKISGTCEMDFADFVRECYDKPEVREKAKIEKWWDHMKDEISLSEIEEAIKNTTSNTAQGRSHVHVNMIKAIRKYDGLANLFNTFLTEGRIPDSMNTALLRLLPKTEEGLSDLDKTRPIALMETIGKLYERILIRRVMKAIEANDILDLGQYGALAEAGTMPPLRILTEVLQDAKFSESELHVMALDLKKAFDTCEYWSQALSWRALGMPKDVVNMLVNLDAGSNNPGDPYEGPGATTSVILDAGHTTDPFTHGRGVRQGSVGGPIKWVVFMDAWLKWIKKTMKGKGYSMSKWRGTNKEVEVLAQMFVDDSIWLANSANAAQEMIRRCELFCDFHKVIINKQKSNYVTMNDKGHQITWNPKIGQSREQAEFKRTGKWGRVTRPKKGETDGRVFKYLGVHFEACVGWQAQARELQAKHDDLVARLKYSAMSIEQATYAINAKIVPAMMYTMQVANMSKSLLRKWDKKHVSIVRKAGNLPMTIPTQIYFLNKENGGLGLISLEECQNERNATLDYIAANERNWKHGDSLLSKVIEAGKAHSSQSASIHRAVSESTEEIAFALEPTPKKALLVNMAKQDAESARESGMDEAVNIYTDGGTREEVSSWAVVIQTQATGGKRKRANIRKDPSVVTLGGRLIGEQKNDMAEAMALLQSLRQIQLGTHANVYIDNLGVVQESEKKLDPHIRYRMNKSGRAIWNRIRALLRLRRSCGATTNIEWVHSHVDDEERAKWKEKSARTCCCGGILESEGMRCDVDHPHHEGNAYADEIATAALEYREEDVEPGHNLHPLSGEEYYYVTIDGVLEQGDIQEELKQRRQRGILQQMRGESASSKANQWVERMIGSDEPSAEGMYKTTKVSKRFKTKLWTDTLPHYVNINQRAAPFTATGLVYGEDLEEGKCRACGNHKETLQHVLTQCEAYGDIRSKMFTKIMGVWKKNKREKYWREHDWMTGGETFVTQQDSVEDWATTNIDGWNMMWGYQGFCPRNKTDDKKVRKCKKEMAVVVLEGAHEIWESRNEKSLAWEKTVGIGERKTKVGRQRWNIKFQGPSRRRGRPTLPDCELNSDSYKERRRLDNKRAQLIKELGKGAGGKKYKEWRAQDLHETRAEAFKEGLGLPDIRDNIGKQRFPKKKASTRNLPKHLRMDKVAVCDIKGCNRLGIQKAVGCKRGTQRCDHMDHKFTKCIGARTWCKCEARDNPDSEDDIIVNRTVLRIRTDEGWVEGMVIHIHQRRIRSKHQTVYHIKPIGDPNTVVSIGDVGEEPLEHMEWWIVGEKESEKTNEQAVGDMIQQGEEVINEILDFEEEIREEMGEAWDPLDDPQEDLTQDDSPEQQDEDGCASVGDKRGRHKEEGQGRGTPRIRLAEDSPSIINEILNFGEEIMEECQAREEAKMEVSRAKARARMVPDNTLYPREPRFSKVKKKRRARKKREDNLDNVALFGVCEEATDGEMEEAMDVTTNQEQPRGDGSAASRSQEGEAPREPPDQHDRRRSNRARRPAQIYNPMVDGANDGEKKRHREKLEEAKTEISRAKARARMVSDNTLSQQELQLLINMSIHISIEHMSRPQGAASPPPNLAGSGAARGEESKASEREKPEQERKKIQKRIDLDYFRRPP